ncbi:serine hydrolase domain-containing protein [Maribacter ulvicola]|uniref:CubicO group peptidase, beta-lactamase class C family n=1 Tax=Maribacter ulvicola TaxID=228959 RepID=A0A1N6Y3F4_9FLAO|nr:serine hydrolase domain-containing protein [Maribacter ulvicola]SIR09152.1 CubicO group peptidase, beta-lactamase class C family [Maribacter ulvicola]
MNPILKYLKNVFAAKRVLRDAPALTGLVKADALLKGMFAADKFPGLAITVLKSGKTIFQKGYGYTDIDKKHYVDPRKSIFRIASVSKPLAATALAHMVQEGLIDLDESFVTYLPDYPKKEWGFTIRQLASHTAGLRVYKGKEFALNEPLSIRDSLSLFKYDPLVFEPGTEYLYNSFGWVMISAAMQEASGIPFEEYVQENVLNPLGMKNTCIPNCYPDDNYKKSGIDVNTIASSEEQNHVATFYTKGIKGFRKAVPVDNFYKLAGGGYLSTSENIAKFGLAFLDKKVEVKEEILNQFLTAQQVNGNSTYYGLGWQVSEDAKGRKFYGHVGSGVGGYSNFFIYPEQQLVFSILINSTDPKIQGELDAVIDCFF